MKESKYVTNLLHCLNSDPTIKAVKYVGSEWGEKGTPDIIGVIDSVAFVIEAKIYPNTLSEIQKRQLDEWREADAIPVIAIYPQDSPKDILEKLKGLRKNWLYEPSWE